MWVDIFVAPPLLNVGERKLIRVQVIAGWFQRVADDFETKKSATLNYGFRCAFHCEGDDVKVDHFPFFDSNF
jgi:hypothetical protein